MPISLSDRIKKEKSEYDEHILSRRSSTSSTRSSCNFPNEIVSSKANSKLATKNLDKDDSSIRISVENEDFKPVFNDEQASTVSSNWDTKSTKSTASSNKLKPSDFFVTNPITNYFNYNKEVNDQLLEQHLMIENEWAKAQFEKHNISHCTVTLFDLKSLDLPKSKLNSKLVYDAKLGQILSLCF